MYKHMQSHEFGREILPAKMKYSIYKFGRNLQCSNIALLRETPSRYTSFNLYYVRIMYSLICYTIRAQKNISIYGQRYIQRNLRSDIVHSHTMGKEMRLFDRLCFLADSYQCSPELFYFLSHAHLRNKSTTFAHTCCPIMLQFGQLTMLINVRFINKQIFRGTILNLDAQWERIFGPFPNHLFFAT